VKSAHGRCPDSVSTMKIALLGALIAAVVRLSVGAMLMWAARSSPELHLVVAADIPTVLTYLVLNHLGWHHDIADASDSLFLSMGVATWFSWGLLGGALTARLARRRKPPIRTSAGGIEPGPP
jgi:hypothetical protein